MVLRILNYILPLTLAVLAYSANGEVSDRQFVTQFQNYRAQHKLTALQTVQAFANYKKVKPEAVLKKLVAAEWEMGGAEKQKAVMNGVEAFEQSGLSHDQALQKISDMVGQLTETLEYLYKQGKAAAGPAPAAVAAAKPVAVPPVRKVAVATYKRR